MKGEKVSRDNREEKVITKKGREDEDLNQW